MFIPDPTFFHPGSRIRTVSIPDPGFSSKYFNPKKTKKVVSKLLTNMIRVVHPGSRIRMLTFYPSRIPDPVVKKAPGSGSATLPGKVTFQDEPGKVLTFVQCCASEMMFSDPDPTSQIIPDPVSDPACIFSVVYQSSPQERCAANSHFIPEIMTIISSCRT
jgi:hypothetical protein